MHLSEHEQFEKEMKEYYTVATGISVDISTGGKIVATKFGYQVISRKYPSSRN